MDSITQATLGAVMGELVLGRKLGWRGAAWGAFLGTVPDLDVLFRPVLTEVQAVYWHRGLSHSLLFIVLGTLMFGWWLHLRWNAKTILFPRVLGVPGRILSAGVVGLLCILGWLPGLGGLRRRCQPLINRMIGWRDSPRFAALLKPEQRPQQVSFSRVLWFVFLAFFTHVMIDCFTTYGTSVWAPFSEVREWWNLMFIIDPFFTLPMLIGLVVSVAWLRKRPTRRRATAVGLAISCAYVAFAIAMKLQVTNAVASQIEGTEKRLVATSPVPLQTMLWRIMVEDDSSYFIGYWSPFDVDGEIQWDVYDKGRKNVFDFEGSPELESLRWFSQGQWIAERNRAGEVFFVDMRFGEVRLPDESGEVQKTPMFVWRLTRDNDGNVDFGGYRVDRTTLSIPKALGRIIRRAGGDEEGW